MLGLVKGWHEFLKVDSADLTGLPRKRLKSGYHDTKKRLTKEIREFCKKNFDSMGETVLSNLYEEIKSRRGLEIPLSEFEEKYSQIKEKVLMGQPRHATVVISLWGLQFMYPEDFFAKDVQEALRIVRSERDKLMAYKEMSQRELEKKKEDVASLIGRKGYASRTCLLCCFNLVESYFNGIAWDFCREKGRWERLSNKRRDFLSDTGHTTIRDKIIKYPEIIGGKPLWSEGEEPVKSFLEEVKLFRDCLVHPSPFSAPERFGGHDKLEKVYRVDDDIAVRSVTLTCEIITKVHAHLSSNPRTDPPWLTDLKKTLVASHDLPDVNKL